MKKNQLFAALACFALLITGCNGGKGSQSSASSNSQKSSSSQKTSSAQSSKTSSSSAADQPADDDYYYSLPFGAGYESAKKWEKGGEWSWTFKVSKNHAKMDFAFGAQMSSSSHGSRSLFTNHDGADSSDSFESNEANDGTPRIEVKVNGVAQTLTTKTYEEAGLTNTEVNYFRVASFAVTAGDVVVSMKTHAQTGYRLLIGEEARLFYPKADGQDPAPTTYAVSFNANGGTGTMADVSVQAGNYTLPANGFTAPEGKVFLGWKVGNEGDLLAPGAELAVSAAVTLYAQWGEAYVVTFAATHCSISVYADEDYTVNPIELNATSTLTRDGNGNPSKYVAADAASGVTEVKPQVNFKVVCEQGYEVDTTCISISGTEHTEWNHLDDVHDNIYRISTIKADITVTITPVATGTLKAGYVATFVKEHCEVKVYTAKNFQTEDTASPYMSRNKTAADDGTYPYAKGEDAQLSFEVVPENGYEFVSGIAVGAEAKADAVNWIAPEGYNKVKRSAENQYNITKVSRDLTINIVCTEKAPDVPVEGTKVTKTVAELATANNWENEAVVNTLTIGEVDVTLTGTSDTKYYSSNSTLRLYVLKNGGAGSVAFAAKQGYKIVSIKLTFSWNKSVGTVETLVSGEATEVNAASASYAITNNDANNNEQMRITAFEIVYDVAA